MTEKQASKIAGAPMEFREWSGQEPGATVCRFGQSGTDANADIPLSEAQTPGVALTLQRFDSTLAEFEAAGVYPQKAEAFASKCRASTNRAWSAQNSVLRCPWGTLSVMFPSPDDSALWLLGVSPNDPYTLKHTRKEDAVQLTDEIFATVGNP